MESTAILAINSLDRYNANQGAGGQPASFAQSLEKQYNRTGQPCNNFQVGGFGALIYGYVKKIQVSQIQLQYNVPTVIPGRNDKFLISSIGLLAPYLVTTVEITIPFGYYTPAELAVLLEIQFTTNAEDLFPGYEPVPPDPPPPIAVTFQAEFNDFVFNNTVQDFLIYFPDIPGIISYYGNAQKYLVPKILKCYRLLGVDIANSEPRSTHQSGVNPEFLYTPYVDIFSTALTKYQKVKDNTTNSTTEQSIIARIYLSGAGVPQNTGGETVFQVTASGNPVPITNYAYPLGSRPFAVTQDCNTPKVVRWNRDETVYALDFQLRDQYGDFLFCQFNQSPDNITNEIFYTEFQMTLQCIEGERG